MRTRIAATILLLAVLALACGGTSGGTPSEDAAGSPDAPDAGGRPDEPNGDADDGEDDQPDPDTPVEGPATPDTGGGDGAAGSYPALPEIREIRDDVRELRDRPFHAARYDETDGSLYVLYTTGVEPCNALGEVIVEEDSSSVRLTLREGHIPEDGQAPACIEIAVEAATRIETAEPLGDRVVVDATTGEEVPVTTVDADEAASS